MPPTPRESGDSPAIGPGWAALQDMALFGGLDEAAVCLLWQSGERLSIDPLAPVFQAGATGQGLFLLLSGRAVAALIDERGCFVLRRFDSGDSFGEAAGIDLQPRNHCVYSTARCELLRLDAAALAALQAHDPEQFTLMVMNMAREFSRRLRVCEQMAAQSWQEAAAQ